MFVPDFRYKALEDEFVSRMTTICRRFSDHGDLKDYFDIPQMIKTLKIEGWKDVPPFEFYLTPLQNSLNKVRKNMLDM